MLCQDFCTTKTMQAISAKMFLILIICLIAQKSIKILDIYNLQTFYLLHELDKPNYFHQQIH